MSSPQQLVEHALETSASPDCVVIVRDATSANLRWANNTLTTNGVMHGVEVTVIAFRDGADRRRSSGTARLDRAGRPRWSRPPTPPSDARSRPRTQRPGRRRCRRRLGRRTRATAIEVYDAFAPALGEVFGRAEAEERVLYGFVNHEVTTTYLGSSTGLRLRHVQPTGHYGCTGKTADLSTSAWVGGATRDFTDVDAHAMADELATRLGWADPAGRPPGRPLRHDPAADGVADLMLYAYWGAGARVAHEGQSVFARRGGGTRIGERVARPGAHLLLRPGVPRPAVRAVRGRLVVRQHQQRLRQRAAARAHGLDPRRHRSPR